MSVQSTGQGNAVKPLLVNTTHAKQLLDVGNSKFWELVKEGMIETVKVGRRDMVVYQSLERLAGLDVPDEPPPPWPGYPGNPSARDPLASEPRERLKANDRSPGTHIVRLFPQ